MVGLQPKRADDDGSNPLVYSVLFLITLGLPAVMLYGIYKSMGRVARKEPDSHFDSHFEDQPVVVGPHPPAVLYLLVVIPKDDVSPNFRSSAFSRQFFGS